MNFGKSARCTAVRWAMAGTALLLVCVVVEGILRRDFMSLLIACGFLLLLLRGMYELPSGQVTPEGVSVRRFFIRRFYRWEDLRQVGVVRCYGRNHHHEIILVTPGGDLRNPESSLCWLRNQLNIIRIPYDEAILAAIGEAKGELHFDQR